MMKTSLLVGSFVIVFCAGLGLGFFLLPALVPERTIYDRLRDQNISFTQSTWNWDQLKNTEYIQEVNSLSWFKSIYEEKSDQTAYAFVDPSVNIAWIEVFDHDTMTMEYIGLYMYSDPD